MGRLRVKVTVILAIDPGLARTGYAILKANKSSHELIDYGCLVTQKTKEPPKRLEVIYQKIDELIQKYQADILVIEQLFFNQNIKTAMAVGQAQGVILLAAGKNNLHHVWYTPGEVKQAVCGYGAASKSQVQAMVQKVLNLQEIPRPDDAADALALAICHAAVANFNSHLSLK